MSESLATAAVVTMPADAAQVKQVRQLAVEVQKLGVELQSLLAKGGELSRARHRAQTMLDASAVEDYMEEATQSTKREHQALGQKLEALAKEKATVMAKLEKRARELDRQKRRLAAVEGVRPAHHTESTKLQETLQEVFAEYLVRHRNLEYITLRLDDLEREEEAAARKEEAAVRKKQARLQRELDGVEDGRHEVRFWEVMKQNRRRSRGDTSTLAHRAMTHAPYPRSPVTNPSHPNLSQTRTRRSRRAASTPPPTIRGASPDWAWTWTSAPLGAVTTRSGPRAARPLSARPTAGWGGGAWAVRAGMVIIWRAWGRWVWVG